MILVSNDLIIVMAMMNTTTTTTAITSITANELDNHSNNNGHGMLDFIFGCFLFCLILIKLIEIIIVNDDDNNITSITNRSNTFYSLDDLSERSSSNDNDDNLTIIDNNDDDTAVDDFWDAPSTHPHIPSSSSTTTTTTGPNNNHNFSNSPSTTTSMTAASTMSATRSTTPFLPPMPSILTWSSSPSSSSSTTASASTLSSSTLPPPFTNIQRISPFTGKPFSSGNESTNRQNSNENNNNNNDPPSFNQLISKIWKIILHGTNMNSEELRMCNRTLIEQHFKPSSRRKVARNMKKDLEKIFNKWNYRFSIIVSSTSRNTMGKSLHGVWMSISINGVHYFITATHKIIDGPKIKEEQMEKIEYWAHVHALAVRNMTGFRRYNRIAQKLKFDLDRFLGHGNSWSVIIVKNPLLVKAKIFEDPEYHIEFSRLNGGHFIIFRGGQTIDVDGRRNGRIDDDQTNHFVDEPESDDHTLETETEHEDYRNNIYLMMT